MTTRPARRAAAPAIALLLALVAPLAAQEREGTETLAVGGDRWISGETVETGSTAVDDLFAAGETVRSTAEVRGSAHLAGRRVEVAAPVAANLYAAGQTVRVAAPVAGDATLAGQEVEITAEVAGGVRAAGQTVRIAAPIGGAALLAADDLIVVAPIAGDAVIAADDVDWGPEARIGGRLTLWGEESEAPPAWVIPADRIDRRAPVAEARHRVWLGVLVAGFATFALAVLAQGAIIGLAPVWSEEAGGRAMARPFRSVGQGALAMAALIGAVPVLAVSIIGIPLTPFALIAAVLAAILGWLMGAAALGGWIWELFRAPVPLSFQSRWLVAGIGILAAVILSGIPYFGWIAMVALAFAGLGGAVAETMERRW